MQSSLPTLIKSTKFSEAEVELLRDTYFRDLNDHEIALALKQVSSMDLNPFNKEIYAYKVGNRLTLVTGVAGFRKIAHRSGDYLGCIVTVMRSGDGAKIISATATVKRLVKSHVASFEATVLFDEYFNATNEKWKKMPEAMIRKTAEINALKMAFPNIESLSEENDPQPLLEAPVDEMPNYEKETQEIEVVAKVVVDTEPVANDPGEVMIRFKRGHKKIKEFTPTELTDFVKWAYAQERLAPAVKVSLANVEEYLKSMEVEIDRNQEATKTQ